MQKRKAAKTINIRVFKEDWRTLKHLARADKRTLQDTFSTVVELARKMRA